MAFISEEPNPMYTLSDIQNSGNIFEIDPNN